MYAWRSEKVNVSFLKNNKNLGYTKMGLLFKCFYLKTCRKLHHVSRSMLVTPYHPFFKNHLFYVWLCLDQFPTNWLFSMKNLYLAVAKCVGSLFNRVMVTFDPLATAHMQWFTWSFFFFPVSVKYHQIKFNIKWHKVHTIKWEEFFFLECTCSLHF